MVRVKKDGQINEVSVNEVSIDTIFEVRPGERIPLDGVITSGQSNINQAPITGESMPVEKKTGEDVFAGTLNEEGLLEIKATKAYNDSTLARIIKLVEEAQEQKAPAQKFVEQFAKYYTPGILVLAFLIFSVPVLFFDGNMDQWLYRALVLLVISCPCALVIATPVSIVSGLTALANKGVLVKGGVYLELLGKMKALAVDKTGTVTLGKPSVHDVISLSSKNADEILWIAGSLDSNSNHPLAQAIVVHAKSKNINLSAVSDFKSITGKGGEGQIEGHPYFIGNHRLAHELGICTPEVEAKLAEIEGKALSVSIVGHKPHDSCKGEILGILAIGDTIRTEAKEAFNKMYEVGVKKVVMLSGDNQRTASAIASEAGIKEAWGDLLPEQKVDKIKELKSQYEVVGMVGDGVNDAPALATASLGIAMGAAGSDTAIETANVALMKDDLNQISFAIHTGKRTLSIIKFNISFALLTKLVFIVLAATGHTSLWLAILADTGATLLVVANSLRLLRS
jgi:Cd2+/Zn2+-exporting ATPase